LSIASTLGRDKIIVTRIPGVKVGQTSPTTVVGWTLGIPRGSKHPDEAWEFIKFFNKPENALEYAMISGEIPFLKSVSDNDFYKNPESEVVNFFVDYVHDQGISIASPPNAEELVVILAEALQRVLLEPTTAVKKILDESVNEYNSLTR